PGELCEQILIGGDVQEPRLRTKGDRRPVLAAPQARTKIGGLASAGLARLVDVGPGSVGVEALEHVLAHKGLAGDEVDLSGGTLKVPDVAAARDVDETFHGSAVALIIDDDWRRYFVPVPRVVGVILEVALYLAAVDIECDDRARVKIVARPLIAEPRGGVAGAPECEIGLRVIGSSHPDRA